VADESVDFAFSFDSLVHAESDVLGDYLSQLARKLKPSGVGFIHHSNIGHYGRLTQLARRAPVRSLERLVRAGVLINIPAWRAESVTAESFARQCDEAGLACVAQELISWEHGRYLIDALTVFTRRGSKWERPREVIRNPLFTDEARRMGRLYARTGFPRASSSR
jgi:hypothetical protein